MSTKLVGGRLFRSAPSRNERRRTTGRQGKGRTAYVWQVVAVPDPDANVFLGRLFRWTDLQRGGWPPGFRFRNIHTGEVWTP